MLCIAEAYQMTELSSQPTKLVKTKNIDLTLRCSLMDKHEKFNQNANVTWWFKRSCKLSCWNQPEESDWTEITCDGGTSCTLALELNDETASNGLYLCRMFPYHTDILATLHIEVTKTFEVTIVGEFDSNAFNKVNLQIHLFSDPMAAPPPELLNDTPNEFSLPLKSQMVLQCKCRSSQKPTIKWFRKKEDSYESHTFESYNIFVDSSRSIKYFESFYEPLDSPGMKELGSNLYLSKLIINNITADSIYVCVAINYFGFSYRETVINIESDEPEIEDGGDVVVEFPEKSYDILFLVPIVLIAPISVLLCTIFYLLIHRQILRNNKVPESV